MRKRDDAIGDRHFELACDVCVVLVDETMDGFTDFASPERVGAREWCVWSRFQSPRELFHLASRDVDVASRRMHVDVPLVHRPGLRCVTLPFEANGEVEQQRGVGRPLTHGLPVVSDRLAAVARDGGCVAQGDQFLDALLGRILSRAHGQQPNENKCGRPSEQGSRSWHLRPPRV